MKIMLCQVVTSDYTTSNRIRWTFLWLRCWKSEVLDCLADRKKEEEKQVFSGTEQEPKPGLLWHWREIKVTL